VNTKCLSIPYFITGNPRQFCNCAFQDRRVPDFGIGSDSFAAFSAKSVEKLWKSG